MNRFLSIIKTHKFVNTFCYIFCALYLIFAIAFAFADYNREIHYSKEMNRLVNSALKVNRKLENEKFFVIDKPQIPAQNTKPLFEDGDTAIIGAFEKLYKSKSFVMVLNGNMSIYKTILNTDYVFNLAVKDTIIKYNNNLTYDDLSICYVNGSFPKVFENDVQTYVCFGSKSLRKGKEITSYSNQKSSMIKGEPVTDYTDIKKEVTPEKCLIADNLPIINRSTIKKIKFYKVNYKNGIPTNYYISAEIDSEKANMKLKEAFNISFPGFSYTPPIYKTTTITACLDAYGNLIYFGTNDEAKETMITPYGKITANCKFYFNYVIGGINKNITFKPEGFDDEFNL